MEERFVIKRKEFKKLERYAENIYNTAVVIDYFCSSQKEYEEEYRIFMRDMLYSTYEDKNNRTATYNIEDLDAIIFGRKVSNEDKRKVIEVMQHHIDKANIKDFKYYDLYYSSITKQLELKPSLSYI